VAISKASRSDVQDRTASLARCAIDYGVESGPYTSTWLRFATGWMLAGVCEMAHLRDDTRVAFPHVGRHPALTRALSPHRGGVACAPGQ